MKLTSWLEHDSARWDAFVQSAPYRSFSQLWAWGELRREAGWQPMRLAVGNRDSSESPDGPGGAEGSDGPDGRDGADGQILAGVQLMVRRVPVLGQALGYAPRGPVGQLDDDGIWGELLAATRRLAIRERIATIRFEPEAEATSDVARRFKAGFWRKAPAVQPVTTRMIDLRRSEDELRGDLRKKHRQYIAKAERAGLQVEEIGPSAPAEAVQKALNDFHAILSETGERAGFNTRVRDYYAGLWQALAPNGQARLFFAGRDGERLATLFHIACGDHVAELYGGATPAGSREHANYLVKWGAILALKEAGMTQYDLWGLPTGGIAQFKEGFGGQEIRLIGARDLVVSVPGDIGVRLALASREVAVRAGSGLRRRQQTDGSAPEGFREATQADASAWQAFLESQPSGDVLHDWEWAAVAAFDGEPQRRFILEESGNVMGICAAQVRRMSFGRAFWYVPRGPVLDYDDPAAPNRLKTLLGGLKTVARAEGAIAVRLEPRVERDSRAVGLLDKAGLRRVDATLQTPDTRLVELLPDDDALLASFDKDTRYAIRRSAREGVETTVISDPNDDAALSELHGIVTETLDRASYRLPSLERYRIAWAGLAEAGRARIIQARHAGALESAALLVVEGDRSIYLYSGSIRERKGEPKRFPSYAVQWQMMLTAREMGSRVHDLWGVAPEDAGPDHPWYGYSLFKRGFRGRFVSWAGSWDLVVDPALYGAREIVSSVRRMATGGRRVTGRVDIGEREQAGNDT